RRYAGMSRHRASFKAAPGTAENQCPKPRPHNNQPAADRRPRRPRTGVDRGKSSMANYTTADVKRLRELTAAGMMDCKKALEETDGDFDKAVELLRIKGAKDVGKRAERTTQNGLIAAQASGNSGVLIELKCETDFVAKGDRFQ